MSIIKKNLYGLFLKVNKVMMVMNLFRLRKKVKINFVTVDSFYQAVAFVDTIESYFKMLNPHLFSIHKCDDLNERNLLKSDIDFFIHHIKDEKYSNRIYITLFNKKLILPLPVSTRASLENTDPNKILNVQIYALYILSLLINKPNHSEAGLLKKLFIDELSKDIFKHPEIILGSLGFESIIILTEVYRNAGLAFLNQNFFLKSRQLESLQVYSDAINDSLGKQAIEINQAKSLADEGVISSNVELIEQSVAICRALLLKGNLSISKEKAINALMCLSFEALRKFEEN